MIPIHVRNERVASFINRAYRESSGEQYIRELLQNSLEAEATRIEIGPEWQAVERLGVFRFMIADNGCGLTPEQSERYLGEFGEGGKAIGGAHENFGIGAKSSTLPWNPNGVVIISYTKEFPDGSMIWLRYDSELGMYGMRELSDDGEAVVEPYDDRDGASDIDWTTVAPDWVREQGGTVVVLLGGNETLHTFWGKRGTDSLRTIRGYINKRFWEIPEGVSVKVEESNAKARRPHSKTEAFATQLPEEGERAPWKLFDKPAAYGAKKYALDDDGASGLVELRDGTRVHWYLCASAPGAAEYKPGCYVAALYRNELYSKSGHSQTFRAWGIGDASVQKRLTLIVEPPAAVDSDGVFPSQARSSLQMQRPTGPAELPWDQWREEFRGDDKMPKEIIEALNAASQPEEGTGERLREIERRLRERYSGENLSTLRTDPEGTELVQPDRPEPREPPPDPPPPPPPPRPRPPRPRIKRPRRVGLGTLAGPEPATIVDGDKSSLPQFKWVTAEEMGDDERKQGATWTEPGAANHNRGLITANKEFGPIRLLVAELQKCWSEAFASKVEEAVHLEIQMSLIGRVAEFRGHMEEFGWIPRDIREALANSTVLTFSLVGFVSELDLIKKQLTVTIGPPRKLRAVVA